MLLLCILSYYRLCTAGRRPPQQRIFCLKKQRFTGIFKLISIIFFITREKGGNITKYPTELAPVIFITPSKFLQHNTVVINMFLLFYIYIPYHYSYPILVDVLFLSHSKWIGNHHYPTWFVTYTWTNLMKKKSQQCATPVTYRTRRQMTTDYILLEYDDKEPLHNFLYMIVQQFSSVMGLIIYGSVTSVI